MPSTARILTSAYLQAIWCLSSLFEWHIKTVLGGKWCRRRWYFELLSNQVWAGLRSPYSDWLRIGWSGDRNQLGARFSAHPASCKMGTGSFMGVKSGQGVTLTPHPLLLPWSWKGRAIPLLLLWTVRPVQSLSACTRVRFTCPIRLNGPNTFSLIFVWPDEWCPLLVITENTYP